MIERLSKREIMTITDAKKNFIIDETLALFFERSISEVTMHDIAIRAGVGDATIYRYFSTKHNLVCAAATKLEKQIFDAYFDFRAATTGFERLSMFYQNYLKIFSSHREFFKFINEFDAYMLDEGKTDSEDYASVLDLYKALCSEAYEQGLSDGSIMSVNDFDTFYYATTHALLELCKKLSAPDIVRQDKSANKEREIATLTELVLFKLKKSS